MDKNSRKLRFQQLCQIEPELRVLWEKSRAIRDDPDRESFCANRHWYRRGGLKSELLVLVGWDARNPRLRGSDNYDVAYYEVYDQLPNCRNCICL